MDNQPLSNSAVLATLPVPMSHSKVEDIVALFIGTFLLSFAINIIQQGGIMTGGTAGLALLLHYVFNVSFGTLFFCINIPFFYLAYKKMGLQLVLKTVAAIGLVSFFSELNPSFFSLENINPIYASLIANIILGVSFLILFRHKSSMGGINLLAMFMNEKYGISVGKFQMFVDISILIASAFFVDFNLLMISIMGAVVLNLIIAMNHRKDRYVAS
jgi:uncharacterized membrane-anchored protein YitT (DUF2179 family)